MEIINQKILELKSLLRELEAHEICGKTTIDENLKNIIRKSLETYGQLIPIFVVFDGETPLVVHGKIEYDIFRELKDENKLPPNIDIDIRVAPIASNNPYTIAKFWAACNFRDIPFEKIQKAMYGARFIYPYFKKLAEENIEKNKLTGEKADKKINALKETAKAVGVNFMYVHACLKLLEIDDWFYQLVWNGHMTAADVSAFLKCIPEKKKDILRHMKVRFEKWTKDKAKQRQTHEKQATNDDEDIDIETDPYQPSQEQMPFEVIDSEKKSLFKWARDKNVWTSATPEKKKATAERHLKLALGGDLNRSKKNDRTEEYSDGQVARIITDVEIGEPMYETLKTVFNHYLGMSIETKEIGKAEMDEAWETYNALAGAIDFDNSNNDQDETEDEDEDEDDETVLEPNIFYNGTNMLEVPNINPAC